MSLCLLLPLGNRSLHGQNSFNYLLLLCLVHLWRKVVLWKSCSLVFLKQKPLSLHADPSTSFRYSQTVCDPGKHSDRHSQTIVRFHSPDFKDGLIPGLPNQSWQSGYGIYIMNKTPCCLGSFIYWDLPLIILSISHPPVMSQKSKHSPKCSHSSYNYMFKVVHLWNSKGDDLKSI